MHPEDLPRIAASSDVVPVGHRGPCPLKGHNALIQKLNPCVRIATGRRQVAIRKQSVAIARRAGWGGGYRMDRRALHVEGCLSHGAEES